MSSSTVPTARNLIASIPGQPNFAPSNDSAAPTALNECFVAYPGLKPWAKLFRAYSAAELLTPKRPLFLTNEITSTAVRLRPVLDGNPSAAKLTSVYGLISVGCS
jgi:hypothetical protein